MKVQTIKSMMIDQYGNRYLYKTTVRTGKSNQLSDTVVTCNGQPLYKEVSNGKKYDMGLFGKWLERNK